MKLVARKDEFTDGGYYLIYARFDQTHKTVCIGRFSKKYGLVEIIYYLSRKEGKLEVIHEGYWGIGYEVGYVFKLSEDEILQHVLTENI